MTKPTAIRRETKDKSAWKVWGPVVLLIVAGFVIAFQFVGPPPPSQLVMATGPEGGAYHRFGKGYRAKLAKSGIDVQLRTTAGSLENLELLRGGEVDVAFVQGGTAQTEESTDEQGDEQAPADGERTLEGVASLYFEPLWVFHRSNVELQILADLAGRTLQIGEPGSGTNTLARTLLNANGVNAQNSTFTQLPPREAVAALQAGEVDAMLVVSGPRNETILTLMAQEGGALTLLDIDRSHSLSQVFRYLSPVLLSEGLISLADDIPDRDVQLVAPTAELVATDELHPAMVPLFIEAARALHGRGGLFERQDQFPSLEGLDVEPSVAAEHYYRSGPSFLYRVLPFGPAAMLDRLKILLLPLLTLLFPLLKIAPPVYRWSIRSKIFRWYKVLNEVESQMTRAEPGSDLTPYEDELDRIEAEILDVSVPPSYGEEAYNLRMHLDLVQARLHERRTAEESVGGFGEADGF